MSVLSKSVKTAQCGRSFTGVPEYGVNRRREGTATCQCGGSALPASVLPAAAKGSQRLQIVRALTPAPRSAPAPEGVTVLYPAAGEPQRLGRAGQRRARILDREAGMATAEYAIATLAAVAFAALLVAVLGSGEVRSLLMGLIRNALTLG
ncbi:DUF4244 domain-containing protein [Arthrobacter jiangjiafuii]|uniref:DUF4244 domain-containing protein n=1 Tax=Arthrobacter jiangjiafuii TaxID=2817475 RepID=A0A975M4G2_9MICC|nr:DUF4244 domain-containing protein [Arthrobacter jiangjiafuii]QWC09717.1 DUF4244 domain-containing protein [Arthrobacter jiangjiafuii]